MSTRRISGVLVGIIALSVCAVMAVPREAEAGVLKLGADAIWVPIAAETVHRDGKPELDASHNLASFGGAAHLNVGIGIFSIGPKINYYNEGLELKKDGESVRRNEIDVNAYPRVNVPATDLALFAEGGGSLSTKFDGFGYNVGAGLEYTSFSVAIVDFNVGLSGQYVHLPLVVDGQSQTKKSGRLNVYIGADFGL